MSKRYLLSIFLFILLGIIFSYFLFSRHRLKNTISEPTQSDGFMIDVIAIKTNAAGQPKSTLISPKLTHYPKNNQTKLLKPHFTFLSKKPRENPWQITANFGLATQGITKVLLWDHVVIHQATSQANKDTRILTSKLTVYPNKNFAKTNKNVVLYQPGSVVKSKGMEANFDTGAINLLSQSRGEYVPTDK